jgi:alpha-galactosidase/6-phospho-beta-glucosidase family protein
MTRIVAIGVGSRMFGSALLRDVFQAAELRGVDLWLVDTDLTALAKMTAIATRLNEASRRDVTIHSTSEREDALPGADFVVTSVAVDRDPSWRMDHQLALKHGFPSVDGENGGPGGLSHTLRSIPLVLEIIRDVERLAPAALVLQYTNPENRVALAIHRYTKVRSIGLCHSAAIAIKWIGELLDRRLDEIEVDVAGVNHFTWALGVRDAITGEDLLDEFLRRLRAMPTDAEMTPASQIVLSKILLEVYGIFPLTGDLHTGEYIGWASEVIGTAGWPWDWANARREQVRRDVEGWAAGASIQPLLDVPSHEAMVNHSATGIMADVLTRRTRRRPSFVLPNDGYIDNVARDGAVEVSGVIRDGRVEGLPMGSLPQGVAAMVNREIDIQKLAVQAAVEGSRELALQALLLDPTVMSLKAARDFLDDVLETHRRHLANFWAS